MPTPNTTSNTHTQNLQDQRNDANHTFSKDEAARNNDEPDVTPILGKPCSVDILHDAAY